MFVHPQPAGLYIHVPFCLRKCPYCDFYSQTDLRLITPFLSALKKEMAIVSPFSASPPAAPIRSFETIYLGGGTPSLLKPREIAGIIEAAYRFFPVSHKAEVTLEANPGAMTSKYFTEVGAAGINRINIGVQSFEDQALRFLGRIHSARQAHSAIRSARKAGIGNIGLDLIYGLPHQSLQDWIRQLQTARTYSPEHLSCYMLTFEPGTLFDQWKKNGKIEARGDETLRSFFETTIDLLETRGYIYYEISNFAKSEQFQSRHNKKYWSHAPYLGLGPSAHSFREPVRYWNHCALSKYLTDVNEGKLPLAGQEILDDDALILERIYLSLRTAEGIAIKALEKRFNMDFYKQFAFILSTLEDQGYISLTPERCRLTPTGRVFCDEIAARIVADTHFNAAYDTDTRRG